MTQFVYVMRGSLTDGHTFVGPFDSPDDLAAVAYYYGKIDDECEVIELEPPPPGASR